MSYIKQTCPDGGTSVSETIRARRSIRAFLDQPVSREDLVDILETAAYAPSGSNFQPWQVHVLQGATLQRVGAAVQQAYLEGEIGHQRDYSYYPDPVVEPFRTRRRHCGVGLYGVLGIGRDDKQAAQAQRARNYVFFGAPVGIVLTMDATLQTGSFLDCGFFVQSLLLAAQEKGLATCPQASLAEYPDIIRRELGLGADRRVIMGIALGYADESHVVNTFKPARANTAEFAAFLD